MELRRAIDYEEAGADAKKDDKLKVEEGKKVLAKVDAKTPPAPGGKDDKAKAAGEKPSASSAEKDAKDKAMLAEAAKLKAEAKAKEAAKAAKAKESEARKPPPPSILPPLPIDLKVQKATWITQGMLCALLFFVHEQLAFVVMGFFIWKHFQDTKARAAAVEAAAIAAADYKSSLAAAAAAEPKRSTKPSVADPSPERAKVPSIVVDPPVAATSGTTKPSSSGTSSKSRGAAAPELDPRVVATSAAGDIMASQKAPATATTDRSIKPHATMDKSGVLPSDTTREVSRAILPGTVSTVPSATSVVKSATSNNFSAGESSSTSPATQTLTSKTNGASSKTVPAEKKAEPAKTEKDRSMPPALVAKLAKMPPETRAKYEARYAQAQAKKKEAEPSGGGEAERGEKRRDLPPKQHEQAGGTVSNAPDRVVDRVVTENDQEADRSDTSKGDKRRIESINSQTETKIPTSVQTAESPENAQPDRATKTESVEQTPPPRQEPREAISRPSSSPSVVAEPAPHPSRREVDVPATEPSIADTTPVLSDEAARKASEKAKAARREERMTDKTGERPSSREKGEKGSHDRATQLEAAPPGVEVRSVTTTERSRPSGKRSDSKSGRAVERKEGTPTVQGLLVEVDDALSAILDPERTPRPGDKASKSDPPSRATEADRRSAIEKLKEERRARLLARADKPAPLASAAAPPVDIVDADLSPVSVYSQNTDVGAEKSDPPKSPRRLTRDVGAAREALADREADKKESSRARSSSVGSFGVIRFDGGKDKLPEPPKTAPILPSLVEERAGPEKDRPKKRKSKETEAEVKESVATASTAGRDESTSTEGKSVGSADEQRRKVADGVPKEKRAEKGKARAESPPESKDKSQRPRSKEQESKQPTRKESEGQARSARKREDKRVEKPERETGEAETGRKRRAEREREKVKPKLRLEDLTPEQVEQMQKEREKRRVRKAREAKEARGEGSSGLTPEEKEELPTSP